METSAEKRRDHRRRDHDARSGVRGRPARLVLATDVTERKRAEAERDALEKQLAQAQRMESIGRLAGGVAHDFNNLLVVILGHAELLLNRPAAADPTVGDSLREIRKAGERAANLTRQLLAFGRKQVLTIKTIDLNRVIAEFEGMLYPPDPGVDRRHDASCPGSRFGEGRPLPDRADPPQPLHQRPGRHAGRRTAHHRNDQRLARRGVREGPHGGPPGPLRHARGERYRQRDGRGRRWRRSSTRSTPRRRRGKGPAWGFPRCTES